MWAFVILVPVFYGSITDLRVVQEKAFQVGAILLASLFLGNAWMTGFVFLNIALMISNGINTGSGQVLNIFMACMLFACSRAYFSKVLVREGHLRIKKCMTPLYILTFITVVMMTLQLCGIDPVYSWVTSSGEVKQFANTNLMSGVFALPAFNGIFLALVNAFMVFYSPVVAIFMLVPIALSKSSAVYLSAFSSLAVYGFYRIRTQKGRIVAGTALCVALLGGFVYDYSYDPLTWKSRFENWHLVLKMSLKRPFGWGPDSFRSYNKTKNWIFSSDENYNPAIEVNNGNNTVDYMYYSADPSKMQERFGGKTPKTRSIWTEAHNEYLQVFFEYGIIGLLLLLGFIREIILRFKKSAQDPEILALFSMLLVYLVASTTQFPFHLARLSCFLPIILGAYYAKTDASYFKKEIHDGRF